MKKYLFFLICLILTSCTDHAKVMNEYENGNENAKEILLHGFNMQNSEYISSSLIKKALEGDEEAKEIIYSQIDTLRGINSSCHHSIPIVIPMNTRR